MAADCTENGDRPLFLAAKPQKKGADPIISSTLLLSARWNGMPRIARVVRPECPVHIVQRGNNRGCCFFGDEDYFAYLTYLQRFAARFECSVHAYCLMTNHVHLLVTPQQENSCGQLMKSLGQCYVQHVNRSLTRTGTLWEGRYRSCLVPSDSYVLACYRYIELNPVRAGLAESPEQYRWSSYGANAQGRTDPLLRPHPSYLGLDEEPARRLKLYAGMFDTPIAQPVIDKLLTGRGKRGRPQKKMGSVPIL
jgi:putative transposase